MKSYIFYFVALISCNALFAQNTFRATVKDADTKEIPAGATAVLKGAASGATTDGNGTGTIEHIPGGEQIIEFAYPGYRSQQQKMVFPLPGSDKTKADFGVNAAFENRLGGDSISAGQRRQRPVLMMTTNPAALTGRKQ
jgi:iron complex outermembrane receptor protein